MSVKADDNFAARANARERDKVAEGRDGQLDEGALPWGNLVGSREVSVLVRGAAHHQSVDWQSCSRSIFNQSFLKSYESVTQN